MKIDRILLSHGSGGKRTHELIQEVFLPYFHNPLLEPLDDGAVFRASDNRWVMTTDSYVVDPIFFPGGNIGTLAISGTVNDLAVMGAKPRYLSVGMILEEGFPISDLKRILQSMRETADRAGVQIITGDTKVVPRGAMDKVFINTAGVGELTGEFGTGRQIQPGDRVLINGTIGDHGTTIMAHREGLELHSEIRSDCAPLNDLIATLSPLGQQVRIMRDPTRGGVATTLNEIVQGTGLGILLQEDALPIRPEVQGLCEILGLDPLYLANEGKVLVVVHPDAAEEALERFRAHPLGEHARLIGEVGEQYPNKVVMQTEFGSKRILDMLTGEQLPRIC